MSALMAAFLLASKPVQYLPVFGPKIHDPTINVSAVRMILCDNSTGTGFVVSKDVLATAGHVADDTNCVDAHSGVPLTRTYNDERNDFALMSGDYPDQGPFIKASCQPYKTGKLYLSYGWRGMLRMEPMIATKKYSSERYQIGGKAWAGMRKLRGKLVPGMSGGPIIDPYTGMAYGLNNVGEWNSKGEMILGYSFELKNTILCK